MTFEDLLKGLEPIVEKAIKKLIKEFQPLIERALKQDDTTRKMVAKLIYKMGCYVTAEAKHLKSCPASYKMLYRSYLCSALKISTF